MHGDESEEECLHDELVGQSVEKHGVVLRDTRRQTRFPHLDKARNYDNTKCELSVSKELRLRTNKRTPNKCHPVIKSGIAGWSHRSCQTRLYCSHPQRLSPKRTSQGVEYITRDDKKNCEL